MAHVLPNGKHHFNLQQKFTCFAIKRYKYTCSCAFDHIPKIISICIQEINSGTLYLLGSTLLRKFGLSEPV